MLGQGYDFPPISVVVPMRPYGSFSEFYQFVGRGIRVITHPALTGRVGPASSASTSSTTPNSGSTSTSTPSTAKTTWTRITEHVVPETWQPAGSGEPLPGTTGTDTAEQPEAFVLFERGAIESRVVHDESASSSAARSASSRRSPSATPSTPRRSASPLTFEQYVDVFKSLSDTP